MIRNPWINGFSNRSSSLILGHIEKKYGSASLSDHHTVASDVVASLKLMRYMDAQGIKADLSISSSPPTEVIESCNIILVGTHGTLTPFQAQLARLPFRFDPQANHDQVHFSTHRSEGSKHDHQ